MTHEARWMERAIELARRAEGRTAPNPMVGAVIVRDGKVLAEAWHEAPGRPHAEPAALARLGARAPGATMVVNLEPCCHHGRTPPCTDAILASGIRRVVVGMVDPHPLVAGQGIERLRAAGIEVVVGVLEDRCRELNAGYLSRVERGRPLVHLKAAATLDGRIADHQGASRWISGEEARAWAHRMRDRCEAVLVGVGTVLADDPALNTRLPGGRDALPVVLDSRLRVPRDARLFRAGRRPVIYTLTDAPRRELPGEVVRLPGRPGRVALDAVLEDLAARGIQNLLVEGGATVHRSFLDAGLADRLHLVLAPRILVGGPGFVGGPPFALAEAPRWRVDEVERLGEDLLVHLRPREG